MNDLRCKGDFSPDHVDWEILQELQQNARIPFSELGRRVGLSAPAVTERVRKLEDSGVITGYRVHLNLQRLGRPIAAIIRLGNPGDRSDQVITQVRAMPEVLSCHRVTGNDAFVIRVAVMSVEHLERVIGQLDPYGSTTTSLILSSPVEDRDVEPLDE